jgi:hypothetical protein
MDTGATLYRADNGYFGKSNHDGAPRAGGAGGLKSNNIVLFAHIVGNYPGANGGNGGEGATGLGGSHGDNGSTYSATPISVNTYAEAGRSYFGFEGGNGQSHKYSINGTLMTPIGGGAGGASAFAKGSDAGYGYSGGASKGDDATLGAGGSGGGNGAIFNTDNTYYGASGGPGFIKINY